MFKLLLRSITVGLGHEVGRELARTGIEALREDAELERQAAARAARRRRLGVGLLVVAAAGLVLTAAFGLGAGTIGAALVLAGAGVAGGWLIAGPALRRRLAARREARNAARTVAALEREVARRS